MIPKTVLDNILYCIKHKKADFHPFYQIYQDMKEDCETHSTRQSFPEKLFEAKSPNEQEAERSYRRQSYQAETIHLWSRAYSQLQRIFTPQNYAITWQSDAEADYFQQQETISFIRDRVLPYSLRDSGAVLYFLPQKGWQIAQCGQVLYIQREAIIILSDEKAWIELSNGKKEKSGLILYLYERGVLHTWKQNGEGYKFESSTHYFNKEVLYAFAVGGIEIDSKEGVKLYKSPFYDAVPCLNQALYDASTLQVVKAAHAFPQRIEYFEACDNEGCQDGFIPDFRFNSGKRTCPKCNGSGWKRKHSPLGVYQLKAGNRLNEGDEQIPFPGVAYVSPNPAILEFLRTEIAYNQKQAFSFMGLEISNGGVKGTETALSKLIDREALFSFLQPISERAFGWLAQCISLEGYEHFGADFKMPILQKPTSFTIRSDEQLTQEYALAYQHKLPKGYKEQLMRDIYSSRYEEDERSKTQLTIRLLCDALLLLSEEEIIARYTNGLVSAWQLYLHDNFLLLWEALEDDEVFMAMSPKEKSGYLIKKAQENDKSSNI